ncbi:MAG: hypothetical protein ACLGRW_13905 [Acidobacteriota bacterium]
MSARRMVAAKIWRLLRARAAWNCTLAALVAILIRPAIAQNQLRFPTESSHSETPSTPNPVAVALAAAGIERAVAVAQSRNAPQSTPAPVEAPSAQQVDGVPADLVENQEIASACADLLRMATDLKAEVDKTTKDTLSVPVVRKAGEIEAFARKLREQDRTKEKAGNR